MSRLKTVTLKVPVEDWILLGQMAKDRAVSLEEVCHEYIHAAASASARFRADPEAFDRDLTARLENHLAPPPLEG